MPAPLLAIAFGAGDSGVFWGGIGGGAFAGGAGVVSCARSEDGGEPHPFSNSDRQPTEIKGTIFFIFLEARAFDSVERLF